MDPIDPILTALTSGAAAGMAEAVVKNAYTGLKEFIRNKYRKVHLDLLEEKPVRESARTLIKEELADADAGKDQELLLKAKELLDLLSEYGLPNRDISGVILKDIRAASVNIQDILAKGKGANVKGVVLDGANIVGDVNVSNVQVVDEGKKSSKKM